VVLLHYLENTAPQFYTTFKSLASHLTVLKYSDAFSCSEHPEVPPERGPEVRRRGASSKGTRGAPSTSSGCSRSLVVQKCRVARKPGKKGRSKEYLLVLGQALRLHCPAVDDAALDIDLDLLAVHRSPSAHRMPLVALALTL
jgi:hypothetical protein